MNDHREQLLERLALGEIASNDPQVLEAARDPDFRAALQEQEALLGSLDERSVRREADAMAPHPDEDKVKDWLTRGRQGPRSAPPSRTGWVWGLLAAAILAVVSLRVLLVPSPQETNALDPLGPQLGQGELRCLRPLAAEDGLELFEWEGGHEGATFEVEVLWGDGRSHRSGRLKERSWRPAADARDQWELPIEWAVYSYEASREMDAAFADVSSP